VQKWRNWGSCGGSGLAAGSEAKVGDRPFGLSIETGVQRVEEAALELGLARSVVYDLLKRYRLRRKP
jgi:hypothetical protein